MLLLAAGVGQARIRLRKHTAPQVALSFAVSLPLTAAIVYLIGPAVL